MTQVVLDVEQLDEAVALLREGLVVGLPTDTVYGLAARFDDRAAVARLFDAKRRPPGLPIAVLCNGIDEAVAIASSWPDPAMRLAAACWPGPMTVIVATDPSVARGVGALDSVGLRVPDDRLCCSVLAATGPLAVTSANLHGQSAATSAREVAERFEDALVVAVLDGGVRSGTISTVVDVSGSDVVIVREGAISREEVDAILSAA